jgi:hypothetical protein
MKRNEDTNRATVALHDAELSSWLDEAYRDDAALQESPERTARILRYVRAAAVVRHAELADATLTALLADAYTDDPALVETPERSKRILRYIHDATHTQPADLADPALATLLSNSYRNDPELAASPGRTERIMRVVMASGVQPVQRGLSWFTLSWATGLAVLAAVSGALFVMNMAPKSLPKEANLPHAPIVNNIVKPPDTPVISVISPVAPATGKVPVSTNGHKRQGNRPYTQPLPPKHPKGPGVPVVPPNDTTTPDPALTVDTRAGEIAMAHAFYEAGTVAVSTGNHSEAADHYYASYLTEPNGPNPEVMMAAAGELLLANSPDTGWPEGGV